jgi:hypothetical protein
MISNKHPSPLAKRISGMNEVSIFPTITGSLLGAIIQLLEISGRQRIFRGIRRVASALAKRYAAAATDEENESNAEANSRQMRLASLRLHQQMHGTKQLLHGLIVDEA